MNRVCNNWIDGQLKYNVAMFADSMIDDNNTSGGD